MKLLVVEDQKELNKLIVRKLESEGYTVDACLTGTDAEDRIKKTDYDGIILDIFLPGKTGLEILKDVRARGNGTPTLFLTALDTVDDRVAGLDAGADDYLVKPFNFDELLARVRAITRRNAETSEVELTAGDLILNPKARVVTRAGKEINLTVKEFELLEYLLRSKGQVLSRDKLSTHVWNYDYDGGSNVIDVYMHHLRKKIDDGFDEKLITTVKGAGYVIR